MGNGVFVHVVNHNIFFTYFYICTIIISVRFMELLMFDCFIF